MTDEIQSGINGDLFASFREVAWHGKGEVFSEPVFSAEAMLDHVPALRDREVRLEPITVNLDGVNIETGTGFVATSHWADSSPTFYGNVGNQYGVMSDKDAYSVFDGFRAETMGSLYDGRKTFASFAIERETVLDPSGVADRVNWYGLGVNSFDGTSPLTWGTTGVRVVCKNTLNVAMAYLSNVYKVRHTHSSADRVAEHAAIYRKSLAYIDEFDALAVALFEATITDKQYVNMLDTLFPKPEEDVKGALTKWENKRGLFVQAWQGAPNAGVRGTAWGAWNALTEANQWGRNVRAGDRGADSFAAAGMGLDGPTNKFRQDTLRLVMSRAGVK